LNCDHTTHEFNHRTRVAKRHNDRVVAQVLHVLPAFLLACLVLAALPGPATALFLHRTMRDGRRAGLAAVAGNEIGVFCWAVAGGAGLSVLLSANRVLFDALHIVGGLVLVALGVQAWRDSRGRGDDGLGAAVAAAPVRARGRTPAAAFRASLISIAANPKAAVFAMSFFPQFLPRSGPVLPTVIALATIQVVLDTAWCAGIVMAADRAREWLSRGAIKQRIERVLGAVLIALGLELAIDTR
jgi:threonine/homoserine/homoserine lactone efflux protein